MSYRIKLIKIELEADACNDDSHMVKKKELWGRKFRIVGNGLDEADVRAFVDSLRGLSKDVDRRLDHMDSPRELAENHMIEGEARASASRIIAQAEEEARTILRQAKEKAEKDTLHAKREVEHLLARSRQLLEGEIRDMFDQAARQMFADYRDAAQTFTDSECKQSSVAENSELEDIAHGQDVAMGESQGQSSPDRKDAGGGKIANPDKDTVALVVTPTVIYSR